jgi:hypothetical protein
MDEDINDKMKEKYTILDVCNESSLYADISHQSVGISISRYHLRPKQRY